MCPVASLDLTGLFPGKRAILDELQFKTKEVETNPTPCMQTPQRIEPLETLNPKS